MPVPVPWYFLQASSFSFLAQTLCSDEISPSCGNTVLPGVYEWRLIVCCLTCQVDPERNLLYVKGQVPGHKGNFVHVKDAVMKTFQQQPVRPFPTFLGQELPGVGKAPASAADPFDYRE